MNNVHNKRIFLLGLLLLFINVFYAQKLGKGNAFENKIILADSQEPLTQDALVKKWENLLKSKLVSFAIKSFYNPEKNLKEYMIIGENADGTYSVASKIRWDKKSKTFYVFEKDLYFTVTCNGCGKGCKPALEFGNVICSNGCKDKCIREVTLRDNELK